MISTLIFIRVWNISISINSLTVYINLAALLSYFGRMEIFMNDIIILVQENEYELINKIKRVCGSVTELKDSNFDGDSSILTFLIAITPVVVTQLGGIIQTLIQNPSKGKVKINGTEIEGFTYEETIKLLDSISMQNTDNKQ